MDKFMIEFEPIAREAGVWPLIQHMNATQIMEFVESIFGGLGVKDMSFEDAQQAVYDEPMYCGMLRMIPEATQRKLFDLYCQYCK